MVQTEILDPIKLWKVGSGEKIDINSGKSGKHISKKEKDAYEHRRHQHMYSFENSSNSKDNLNTFRDFVNQSSNIINPSSFCDKVKDIFKKHRNVSIDVMDVDKLKEHNLNLVLSVDKISSKMLICEYKNSDNKSPIVIVGKGVTIDTGGYAIKNNNAMRNMHLDKTGGVMALYIIHELACKRVADNIVVIVPLVQNNISHCATKPGDIVTSYSGLKVEIRNPDAEGRLILADGISYAIDKYKPRYIIDMGTLTSMPYCNISYGYFSLSSKIRNIVCKSGKDCIQRLYEMPSWPEYKVYTKSNRADVANAEFTCPDQFVSAMFLLCFIPKKYENRWLHINLASTSVKDGLSVLEGSNSLLTIIQKMMTL